MKAPGQAFCAVIRDKRPAPCPLEKNPSRDTTPIFPVLLFESAFQEFFRFLVFVFRVNLICRPLHNSFLLKTINVSYLKNEGGLDFLAKQVYRESKGKGRFLPVREFSRQQGIITLLKLVPMIFTPGPRRRKKGVQQRGSFQSREIGLSRI